MKSIVAHYTGLSDHLPVFGVRLYKIKASGTNKTQTTITYRQMKHFNEQEFKTTLEQTPWDSTFGFDDPDDMLSAWEDMLNQALDDHCPWKIKLVTR